jgi:glycosyltransferase involved in cell wall biosynthesis
VRILHVDTGREMRGGQRQVLLLSKGLTAAGYESVLLARENSPLFQAAEQANIAVYPANLRNLWRRSKQAHLLHAHEARAHSAAALASQVPFVVSRRVAFPPKQSMLSKWKYHKASRFLAVSEFVAGELERSGIDKQKIDTVYDGVDAEGREGQWCVDGPAIALASGDPAKGRDLLEQASHLAKVPLLYSNNLPADFARSASLFVYITRSEGLGSAALLAMAMGIPVVGSDVGGLREALGFGDAGILVPNVPEAIAAAIRRLREDSDLAKTFIERGKTRVFQTFTTQILIETTLASYRRALAG